MQLSYSLWLVSLSIFAQNDCSSKGKPLHKFMNWNISFGIQHTSLVDIVGR